MEIAIANADRPQEVSLWAEIDEEQESDDLQFTVINGGWSGSISSEGLLTVHETGSVIRAKIVWRGTSPFRAYEDAIPWIESQIAGMPGEEGYWGA